jgi:hypothetical protein
MPTSNVQWAWFFFWGIGSLGGWVVLAILGIEAVKVFRKVRT